MGYVTVLVVDNDALPTIQNDSNFGNALAKAIKSMGGRREKCVSVTASNTKPSRIYTSAAKTVCQTGTDERIVVAVIDTSGSLSESFEIY